MQRDDEVADDQHDTHDEHHHVRDMIAVAGGVDRLRPHVKTHKLPEVIRRQLVLGIRKFKCATIAEAEMLAEGIDRRTMRDPAFVKAGAPL